MRLQLHRSGQLVDDLALGYVADGGVGEVAEHRRLGEDVVDEPLHVAGGLGEGVVGDGDVGERLRVALRRGVRHPRAGGAAAAAASAAEGLGGEEPGDLEARREGELDCLVGLNLRRWRRAGAECDWALLQGGGGHCSCWLLILAASEVVLRAERERFENVWRLKLKGGLWAEMNG